MKKVLKKILILFIIILILNNFFIGASYVKAYEIGDITNVLLGVAGGVVGILTWPMRLVAALAGYSINFLTAKIAYVDGATEGNSVQNSITAFDIFFNKVKILDVNFFDIPNDDSIVSQMRTSIAGWYYVMRILASAILLVILIYVGIRMAISTVASDKAMYKKMLVDWVASLALIFVLQYIMIFAITANNTIVNAISMVVDSEEISKVYGNIALMSITSFSLDSLAATAIYCMLVWQTLGLVISYFNRMLKLAFLVVIAPLVTLTYSIDKMGDGKAQALEAWIKEFVFTILIQPFHCIIYMCFIDAAFNILLSKSGLGGITDGGGSLAAAIVALLCVKFVKEGEKIVRKIFAFKDDNSQTSVAAGMAASAIALNKAKSIGKTTRKAVNGVANFGRNASELLRNGKIDAIAMSRYMKDKDGDKSFSDYKEEASIALAEKEEAKAIKKTPEEARLSDCEFKKQMQAETARVKDLHPGMSDKEAKAIARRNVAQKIRKKNTFAGKKIEKARGRINNAKNKINNSTIGQAISSIRESETGKLLKDFNKASINAGLGFMIGSGVYGTTGNLATAITSGVAMNAGMSEFMSGSKRTLANGINKNLSNLGITKSVDARNMIKEIGAESEKYDDSDKCKEEVKKLIDEVMKELAKVNNGVDHSKISNNINEALSNPLTAPDEIKSILASNNVNLDGDAGKNLINYSNKKAIYSQLQNSEAAGISQSSLMETIDSSFDSSGADQSTSYDVEQIMGDGHDVSQEYDMSRYTDEEYGEIALYEEEMKENNERLDELNKKENLTDDEEAEKAKLEEENKFFAETIDDITKRQNILDEEFEDFAKEIDEEISKQYDTLTDLTPSTPGYEEVVSKIEKLKVEQASSIAKKLVTDERYLTTLGSNMARKYQRKLDEAISLLEQKAKNSKGTKDYAKYDDRIAELQEVNLKLVENIK